MWVYYSVAWFSLWRPQLQHPFPRYQPVLTLSTSFPCPDSRVSLEQFGGSPEQLSANISASGFIPMADEGITFRSCPRHVHELFLVARSPVPAATCRWQSRGSAALSPAPRLQMVRVKQWGEPTLPRHFGADAVTRRLTLACCREPRSSRQARECWHVVQTAACAPRCS